MLLPRFELHRPASLTEACQVLGEYGDQAKVLAGGTDLLVNMKRKKVQPAQVVALDRVPDLDGVDDSGAEVVIGAKTRAADLVPGKALDGFTGALTQAAENLGSPLIRNLATIGGNLATARPAGDMAPPLICMSASVVLESNAGRREVLLDEFFLGPGESVMKPEEVLTHIKIPKPQGAAGGGYEKLGLRQAMEIGIVNAAAFITLAGDGRTIESAKVTLGAVGPTPIRSPQAEAVLIGAQAGDEAFQRAGEAAVGDSCAIDDFRGTIEYRCLVLNVLTRRALTKAWDQIRSGEGGRS